MGSPESVQQIVIVLKDSEQKGHGPSACQPLGRRKRAGLMVTPAVPLQLAEGQLLCKLSLAKQPASRGEGWGLLPKAQGLAQLVS